MSTVGCVGLERHEKDPRECLIGKAMVPNRQRFVTSLEVTSKIYQVERQVSVIQTHSVIPHRG